MAFGKGFKFGDTPTSTLIDKFKLEDGEVKFITILDVANVIVAQLHFLKPLGSFHCWRTEDEDGIVQKGSCCKMLENLNDDEIKGYPSQKLVLPIAIFRAKDNKTFDTESISFARLELNQDSYKELLGSLSDEDIDPMDITKCVIRVRGEEKGKGQYKSIAPKFRVRPDKSPILTSNNLKEQTKDFLARYGELIESSLGKVITEEKLVKVIEQRKLEEGEVTGTSAIDEEEVIVAEVEDAEGISTSAPKSTAKANVSDMSVDVSFDESIDLSSILDDDFLND